MAEACAGTCHLKAIQTPFERYFNAMLTRMYSVLRPTEDLERQQGELIDQNRINEEERRGLLLACAEDLERAHEESNRVVVHAKSIHEQEKQALLQAFNPNSTPI